MWFTWQFHLGNCLANVQLMQAHKQSCISSAVFLWCNIVVIFIARFITTGVCQAALAPLQAHKLWWTDGLSIPLAGILPYMGLLGHTGLHDSPAASRPIFLVLITTRKLQLGKNLWFNLLQLLLQARSEPCSSRPCGTGRSTRAWRSSSAATRKAILYLRTDPVGKCAPMGTHTPAFNLWPCLSALRLEGKRYFTGKWIDNYCV